MRIRPRMPNALSKPCCTLAALLSSFVILHSSLATAASRWAESLAFWSWGDVQALDTQIRDHEQRLAQLAAPLMINGLSRGKARKRGQELLRQMGLAERDHHRPGQLSGGEQQRVAIARSLANRPKVLIADEPTGNLDPNTSRVVFQNLFDIAKQEGVAVLVATHNVELTSVMDRVLTLHDGRLEPAPARAD